MAINIKFKLTDNTDEYLQLYEQAIDRALERCGMQAESYALDLVPVDTSALKQSITHKVDETEKSVYIGTDMEYAPYVELGTGIYAEGGGGRPTPWVYQDANGNWHHTRGQEPQPYLRPALKDHKRTYRNIFVDELRNSGAGTVVKKQKKPK